MAKPTSKQVHWLLVDLCKKLGFSMAVRDPEHFEALVTEGPDTFADAVLVAEGLEPEWDKRMRGEAREFVASRFAQWEAEGAD